MTPRNPKVRPAIPGLVRARQAAEVARKQMFIQRMVARMRESERQRLEVVA